MPSDNSDRVEGLGNDTQWVSDFKLIKEDGSVLFSVEKETGDVTIAGTLSGGSSAPSGPAGGDLSGTYPNPVVSKIEGVDISTVDPTAGQVLTATSASAAEWQTPSAASPAGASGAVQFNDGGSFGGDETKLFLDSTSGNVGIGIATPNAALDIQNTAEGLIHIESEDALVGLAMENADSASLWTLGVNDTSATFDPSGSLSFVHSGDSKLNLRTDGMLVLGTNLLASEGAHIGLVDAATNAIGSKHLAILVSNNYGGAIPADGGINADGNMNLGGDFSGAGFVEAGTFVNAASYKVGGVAGASAGPFTTITSITVVNGIVTDLQGS